MDLSDKTTQVVELPYSVIFLAEKMAAQDSERTVLNTVHIDPKRRVAEATDGFHMGQVKIPHENLMSLVGDLLIPVQALKQVKRIAKKGENLRVEFYLITDDASINTEDVMLMFDPVDGAYPDLDTVGERFTEPRDTVYLQANYLKQVAEMSKLAGGEGLYDWVKLETNGQGGLVKFSIGTTDVTGDSIEGFVESGLSAAAMPLQIGDERWQP